MKHLVLLLHLFAGCGFFVPTLAQSKRLKDSVYIGTATTDAGRMMTYKLAFTSLNDGYSVTDVGGKDETHAAVACTAAKNGREIRFQEQSVLSSADIQISDHFCIMQGSLAVKHYKGTEVLKGHFEGYLDGGKTLCASGKLVLVSPADVFKLLGKVPEDGDTAVSETPEAAGSKPAAQDATPRVVATTRDSVPSATPESRPRCATVTIEPVPAVVEALQPGRVKILETNGPDFTLEVWDNKDIDGDVLTVTHGRKALLKNYTLAAQPFRVRDDLAGTSDSLSFQAVSEGGIPLNTARIRLETGGIVTYLDVVTTIEKGGTIVLHRRK